MTLKNKVLSVCALAFLVGCTNSANMNLPTTKSSLDHAKHECKMPVAGVYKAMLPCADCDGINATLNLKPDGTFEMTQATDKHSDKDSGKYTLSGNIVTTENLYKEKNMYKKVCGGLKMLDAEGKEATGELAKHYTFMKIQ